MPEPTTRTTLREDFGLLLEGRGAGLDKLDRDEVIALYKQHGALLFRGFDVDVPRFRDFTNQLGVFRAHGGVFPAREDVDPEAAIQTVEAGAMPLPPHAELRWGPFSPELVFFYCETAPQARGETTLYDGRQIRAKLSAVTRAQLDGKVLRFTYDAPPVYDWRKMLDARDPAEAAARLDHLDNHLYEGSHRFEFRGDTLHLEYRIPVFTRSKFSEERAFCSGLLSGYGAHASWDDGSPVPLALKRELFVACEAVAVPIAWRDRDFVMIDNTRVMHGRRAWDAKGSQRRIFTRFGATRF
ncbi:TauD/TfdA family dioxygenase [Myxococcaceae bacterium GXIMD 01537]